MTALMLHEAVGLPPVDRWDLGDAAWLDHGDILQSGSHACCDMLTSPVVELPGGCVHEIRLALDILGNGGVTFGVRDPITQQWLQYRNYSGHGPRDCKVSLRLVKPGQFRFVLANWRNNGPAVTRLKNLRVDLCRRDLDTTVPAEHWKDEIRKQWNADPCGNDRGGSHDRGTLEYFQAIERDRYEAFSPWMRSAIGFERYAGKHLLEIGGGIGTDLAQFARAGAIVTDFDMSRTHLELAQRNLEARGLRGTFVLGDAEDLPFAPASFDAVYSFGVLHHTPDAEQAVRHIHRVLKPGGEATVMVYARHSWNYWMTNVYRRWWREGLRHTMSIAEMLSAYTEHSPTGASPLVKVYTARQCCRLFAAFDRVRVRKFQLTPGELPPWMLRLAPIHFWGRLMGWNLLINAIK